MKYLINADTALNTFKPAGNPFDCTIKFSQTHRRVRSVSLKNAQIPLGFYNIRAPYNTVTINGVGYTMSPGNYSASTFLNALNSAVTAAVGVFSIANATNLITFVPASGSATITTNVNPPDLGTLLGFSNAVTGSNITASNCYIINFDTYINVWMQNIGTSSLETTMCSFKIPLSGGPGTIIQWAEKSQNEARVCVTDSSVIVDRLIIKVLDRFGQPLNNNGLDWSFTLEVEADT
jgi:hypothetical protein